VRVISMMDFLLRLWRILLIFEGLGEYRRSFPCDESNRSVKIALTSKFSDT
jgi:hypothetical protein